jgi:hypothetical protein
MGIFGQSKQKDASINLKVALRLDCKHIRYVTERLKTHSEEILGREGSINIVNNDIVVSCDKGAVFRCDLLTVSAAELLSLEGAVLSGYDKLVGRERTIVAYYKYYR